MLCNVLRDVFGSICEFMRIIMIHTSLKNCSLEIARNTHRSETNGNATKYVWDETVKIVFFSSYSYIFFSHCTYPGNQSSNHMSHDYFHQFIAILYVLLYIDIECFMCVYWKAVSIPKMQCGRDIYVYEMNKYINFSFFYTAPIKNDFKKFFDNFCCLQLHCTTLLLGTWGDLFHAKIQINNQLKACS